MSVTEVAFYAVLSRPKGEPKWTLMSAHDLPAFADDALRRLKKKDAHDPAADSRGYDYAVALVKGEVQP